MGVKPDLQINWSTRKRPAKISNWVEAKRGANDGYG